MNYDEREGRAGQTRGSARRDAGLAAESTTAGNWLLAAAVSGGLTRLSFFYPLPT